MTTSAAAAARRIIEAHDKITPDKPMEFAPADAVTCARYILSLVPSADVLAGARELVCSFGCAWLRSGAYLEAAINDVAAFASAHAAAEREAGREEVLSMLSDDLEDDMRKEFGWSKTP